MDVILEGAARVFAERGHADATTNHIAEAAGVSVGSLYEYFPNKDAILASVAELHLEHMMADVHTALAESDATEPAALLHEFAEAMLVAHEQHETLHRLVFTEAPHPPELHECVLRMEGALASTLEERLGPMLPRPLRHAEAHLAVQAAEALAHRYVQHGVHDLDRDAFVGELVALLAGYLGSG